ncbi:MAG: DUF2490 domain-containing protein [Acidobacteriota bacterium]
MLRSCSFLILLLGLLAFSVGAQDLDPQDDVQSWNDLQLTVPLSTQFDFTTTVTIRFGRDVSRFSDGRYQIGFVWKPNKAISIQPFYWYVRTRNSNGQFRTEHWFTLRGTYRFPVKGFGLSHRSTVEYRIRRPRSGLRYRPAITIEKDLLKSLLPGSKIYFTEEPFYDFIANKFTRNRMTLGVSKTINKNLSLDLFYMRQNDGAARPGDLHVIGTAWRVKL